MDKEEAGEIISFKRILNKFIFLFISSKLIPSKVRLFFYKIIGVSFKNHNTVFIGPNVTVDGIYPQNISIDDNFIITSGTKILTHFIDTKKLSLSPKHHFSFYKGKIDIEDNVFIGYNVIISKLLKIGEGSIICANSVVVKDVLPNTVVAGIPAKHIRTLINE